MNIERDKWSPEQRRMDRAIREVARAVEHYAKAMSPKNGGVNAPFH